MQKKEVKPSLDKFHYLFGLYLQKSCHYYNTLIIPHLYPSCEVSSFTLL